MKRIPLLVLLFICVGPLIALLAQGPPTGTQRRVTLTWTTPSPVGGSGTVAGYNVYRTPPGAPAYVKINSAVITGTSMVDTNVTAGETYGYCGTVVDSAGSESTCTMPVNATPPENPNPQRDFRAVSQ